LLTKNSKLPLRTAVIIGSANITRQLEKLKEKPHIIVGSAGRILELIAKKKLSGHTVKTIVVDEADRMIDDKNIDSVKAVIKTTLKDRQILMFSATMSDKAKQIAKDIMNEPEIVEAKSKELLPDTITNIYFVCERRDKIDVLRKIIRSEKPERVIVFINDPNAIETTIEKLEYHKLKASGIYGLADKLERKKAMDDFRSGRTPILVSSDLSSRGLDIEGVTHVISLDIPEEPGFYLHRAGRTGRAGKSGYSISIVTEAEEQWLKKYEKQFDIKIEKREMSRGKIEEEYIKTPHKKVVGDKKADYNKKYPINNKKMNSNKKSVDNKKSSMKKVYNKNNNG
jgi:superfamily II DNA/RNA helicase